VGIPLCSLDVESATTIPGTGRLLGGSAFPKREAGLWPEKGKHLMPLRPTGEGVNEPSILGNRRKGITKLRANSWPRRAKFDNQRQMGILFSTAHVGENFQEVLRLGQGREVNIVYRQRAALLGSLPSKLLGS
jgi:hypothetical protein